MKGGRISKIYVLIIAILLVAVGVESYFLVQVPKVAEMSKRELIIRHSFADYITIDCIKSATGADWQSIIFSIYDGLVSWQGQGRYPGATPGKVVPELALRWSISEDGKEWTFYLRENVMFHKGYGEMTAEDVKYSFERAKDSESGSIYVDRYEPIKKIEVLDRYIVRFTVENVTYGYERGNLGLFAWEETGAVGIVSKRAVEEVGSKEYGMEPIGTGPFVFESHVPKVKVVLTANREYWKGTPWLDRITMKMMTEEKTANVALEKREIDWTVDVTSTEDIERFQENPDIIVGSSEKCWVSYGMAMNVEIEPFDDVRVRRAVQYAIDMPAIINALVGMEGKVANSPFPPLAEGYLSPSELDINEVYSYDPEEAKRLLKEAGYPNGFETTVVTHPYVKHDKIFEAIIAFLEDVGIHVDLRIVDVPTWREYMAKKETPIIAHGITSTPWMYLHSNGSDTASRYTGVDNLFEQAWSEPDVVRRAEIYQQIQRKVVEDAVYVPFYQLYQIGAWRSYVKGFELGSAKKHWFYSIYFSWPGES